MTNIVVGLTNDDPHTNAPVYKQYYHVQFDGTVEVSATVTVEFPPSQEKYRYVIIQNKFSHNEAICMAEVKVYVRGIHAFVQHCENINTCRCCSYLDQSTPTRHVCTFYVCFPESPEGFPLQALIPTTFTPAFVVPAQ